MVTFGFTLVTIGFSPKVKISYCRVKFIVFLYCGNFGIYLQKDFLTAVTFQF
jgi:hypothetical protein